jgi:hypothetical protein
MHLPVRVLPALVAPLSLITVLSLDAQPGSSSREVANYGNNPASAPVDSERIISQLVISNRRRESLLKRYSAVRRYRVKTTTGRVLGEQIVLMEYQSPGSKSFRVLSSKGSALMRAAVKRLINGEINAATPRRRQQNVIDPLNYTLNLLGDELVETYDCWALGMVPKRKTKYLIRGKLWATKKDLGTLKIAGEPAKSPSFWIKHVDFIRQYQCIDEFWLPKRDEITADIRFVGRRILTIDYTDYKVNGGP